MTNPELVIEYDIPGLSEQEASAAEKKSLKTAKVEFTDKPVVVDGEYH